MSAAASSMYIQNGLSCWRHMDVQNLTQDKALPWKCTSTSAWKHIRNTPPLLMKAKSDPRLTRIPQRAPRIREDTLSPRLSEPAACPGSPHRFLQPPNASP